MSSTNDGNKKYIIGAIVISIAGGVIGFLKKNQIIIRKFGNDNDKSLLENPQKTNEDNKELIKTNQNGIIRINNDGNNNLRNLELREEEKEKVEKSNLNSTNNFRNHKTTISNRNVENDFVYDMEEQKIKKSNIAIKNLNKKRIQTKNYKNYDEDNIHEFNLQDSSNLSIDEENLIEPKEDFRLSKLPKKDTNDNMSSNKFSIPGKLSLNLITSNLNSNEKNLGNLNNYFSNPFLIYDDVNENIRNTIRKEISNNSYVNHDFSLSLERAYLPLEIENIHGNYDEKFDSLGYIEEDSDDNKENIDETFFNSDNNNEKILPDNNNQDNQNNFLTTKQSSANRIRINSYRNRKSDQIEILERSTIKSKEELDDLFKGVKNCTVKYSKLFEEITIKNENNENYCITILKPEQFLIILKYMYEILHPFLIDLSDQLLIERIKYFEKEKEIYISIIKQYLAIKDKTFNYILEDLMKKLNISEEIMDSSFSYYLWIADKTIKINQEINKAYDDIIHADYKYAIVPKNLNKNKLKNIINAQCGEYEDLVEKCQGIGSEIMEIMVSDKIQSLYGMDRESIRAARIKHNFAEDPFFGEVNKRLCILQQKAKMDNNY